ncbi:MAG: protein-L-isoaspartate O-methyltransferase [Rhodocyclaceae bacterium]|nr:protein-L-isoaspartate O-methyltransferase [Rhodocyclaceae bacterium]
MDIEQARFNMVEQQIRPWDVLDTEVLDLLYEVKREEFVPSAYRRLAFADLEIPIGHGATTLSPKIEAKLLQAAAPRKTDKVLEVGTGTGYMAALLGARADRVLTVEIVPELAALARDNLLRARCLNVSVIVGDGSSGCPERGPFDLIVVSGSVPDLPQALLDQLKPGGRLVGIVGELPIMSAVRVTRDAEQVFSTTRLFETVAPALRTEKKSHFVF